MKIAANTAGLTANDDGTLDLYCGVGWVQSGVATNLGIHVTVTIPTILTVLLLNEAVQQAIANYLNANYSLSILATDVILFSGVTNI